MPIRHREGLTQTGVRMPSLLRLSAGTFWSASAPVRLISVLSALFLLQGCASPQTRPWHDEILKEEFSARRMDEVRDFDAYRELEQRLAEELAERVYAPTPTGPDQALVRYSRGSLADPDTRNPNWNWSFELPADNARGAILLLHGMSDSPYSLRALGEALNGSGYHVLGLRLPGHGTAPSGLRTVKVADMSAAVVLAAEHLAEKSPGRPLHLIGYSTGATLAVDFALDALEGRVKPAPASLVLVSPALGLHAAAGLAGVKRRIGGIPGLGGLAWLTLEPEFDPYKYNSFATNAGEQVHRLTRQARARLVRLQGSPMLQSFPPTLVFKSEADATVSTGAVVTNLLARLPQSAHELVVFDINRAASKSVLLAADPRALSTRLMGDAALPFAVTLITNRSENDRRLEARHQPPGTGVISSIEPLNLKWPPRVFSLSHVALPFPPDDPLYGRRPPESDDLLFLGQMDIQGERGLLLFPSDFLLRLRHNPFYDHLQARTLAWVATTGADRQRPATAAAAQGR